MLGWGWGIYKYQEMKSGKGKIKADRMMKAEGYKYTKSNVHALHKVYR